jgi:uncharacterized protein YjeT (DUF2065 family)
MKKSILGVALSFVLMVGGIVPVKAQEEPKPQKDTVNIDTDAKPQFYYSVEDEKAGTENKEGKSPVVLVAIIVGAVIVVGGIGLLLLKNKKKH